MFSSSLIPLFILLFLILCFLLITFIHKPANIPNKKKEGFQTITSTTSTDVPGGSRVTWSANSGSGSNKGSGYTPFLSIWSGSNIYISQFDTPVDNYGKWATTDHDDYYNNYETNELIATYNALSSIKDLTPVPADIPNYGSALGTFDSETTTIPWDADNKGSNQSDIVWGVVSQQASKSIFFKTWLQELVNNAENMQECGENSSFFCYRSPLFQVNVTDPKTAEEYKAAENVTEAVGQSVQMNLMGHVIGEGQVYREAVLDANGQPIRENGNIVTREVRNTFLNRFRQNYSLITGQASRQSIRLDPPPMVRAQVGSGIGHAVGFRKLYDLAKSQIARLTANYERIIVRAATQQAERAGIALSTAAGLQVGAVITGFFFPVIGGTFALVATTVFTFLTWFFGTFQLYLMGIQAIVQPIADAGFKVGGICPPNTARLSTLINNPTAMTIIADFVAPILQTFDPFVCWAPDGSVHLAQPPKIPPFMADRTLSLIYHPSWTVNVMESASQVPLTTQQRAVLNEFIAGRAPNIPMGTDLTIQSDALPPNFKYLADSDLAPLIRGNAPATSSLIQWAQNNKNFVTYSSGSLSSGGSQSGEAQYLAVETCPEGLTPSSDGHRCNARVYNTTTQEPILTPCPTGQFDDGFNCWTSAEARNGCSGGEIYFTTSTSWDDTYGYMHPNTTPQSGTCTAGSATAGYVTRMYCAEGYEKEPGGLICYAKCSSGYTRRGAICTSTARPRDRQFMFATHSMYYDQPFTPETLTGTLNPPNDPNGIYTDVRIPYCNFAHPTMLNRMSQFYYNNSLNNPYLNSDGTITVQMITRFLGVVASSELSCDVVCDIAFISYDPISGENLSAYVGCSYKDDPKWENCSYCFRRFYFIKGPNDPQGFFTVTGCTFADYTAPDAMVQSSDIGSNLVPSLPKTWREHDKQASIFSYEAIRANSNNITINALIGELNVGIMLALSRVGGVAGGAAAAGARAGVAVGARAGVAAGARAGLTAARAATRMELQAAATAAGEAVIASAERTAVAAGRSLTAAETAAAQLAARNVETAAVRGGMIGEFLGGIGGGSAGLYLQPVLERAANSAIHPDQVHCTTDTFITGSDMYHLSALTNNDWFTVEHGPIYELAPGHIPTINFCENRIIGIDHCSHKYVIRDMVDKYHNENEYEHIKYITGIEPRGRDGCYYSFVKVTYDPNTNVEGVEELDGEVILTNTIKDYSSCTYKPNNFIKDMSNPSYQIRSHIDSSTAYTPTPKTVYPTRATAYTSDLYARYVRVRCAPTNGYLNLSQIAVFDVSGFNVSVLKPTYATSTDPNGITGDNVVSGATNSGLTLSSLWMPATQGSTNEYWEVDLGTNINIAEVVYVGGSMTTTSYSGSGSGSGSGSEGSTYRIPNRNIGVQIEFLYTNGANDTPIYTISLPTDEATQYIPVYSSVFRKPVYPLSGRIMIPRPAVSGLLLGVDYGCINKCEDKDTIYSLTNQFNSDSRNAGKQIVKVLNGITAKKNLCEYQVETMTMLTQDVKDSTGVVTVPGKRILQNEYLTINTGTPTTSNVIVSNACGRYVRITPSFKYGTVLEFSKINVWSAVPDGTTGKKKAGYNISIGKPTSHYNNLYELDRALSNPANSNPALTDGGSTASVYPNVFVARDNDPSTYFEIDLLGAGGSGGGSSCSGNNYELYQIQFIARSDRTCSIVGIKIELFADRPGDEEKCCDGTYPPVFRYTIQSEDPVQMIPVFPPANCSFQIQSSSFSPNPFYLNANTPAFSTTDTSGGVFFFSGFLDSMKTAWNNLLPMKSTDLTAPITQNVQQSDTIVHGILDTLAQNQVIRGTTKKCNDTDIMSAMMTAFNIARGPTDEEEYGINKTTMKRIIKSAQSTPTTCDVLYEGVQELYEDYIKDITDPTMKNTSVKGVRFNFQNGAVPALDAPHADQLNIMDISSNALGFLTNAGNLTTPFTGPTYAVNCRDPNILRTIKGILEQNVRRSSSTTTRSTFTAVTASFQSTPLSCEYMMTRDDMNTMNRFNYSYPTNGLVTYAKAIFTLGSDGKTTTLSSAREYYPGDITVSADKTKVFINRQEVHLPSIFGYADTKVTSTRVNSTRQTL